MKLLNILAMTSCLYSPFLFASGKFSHDDWVCFIDPFDLNPENRINILGSIDASAVLHVEEDGKTIKKQQPMTIKKIENIQNTRNFGFTDGSAMAVIIDTSYGFNTSNNGKKLEVRGDWYPAFYLKGDSSGGYSYRCKAVELIRD